jgi:hypothetical protein
MSGSLVGGVIGAGIGFFMGGNIAMGWAIGSAIGGAIAPGSLPDKIGPRMSDLKPQSSEYGRPIPIVYGTIGLAGNVIWAAPITEVSTSTEEGGKGGPSQTSTTFTYFGDFAIAVCEGTVDLGRIWAGPDKRLIYDGIALEGTIRFYNGSESQLPDPLLESYLGVGNAPAYRGTAYLVFDKFPLEKDGNRIPFITVEVGKQAAQPPLDPVYLGASAPIPPSERQNAVLDQAGNVWSAPNSFLDSTVEVRVNSDVTKTQIASFSVAVGPDTFSGSDICFIPGGYIDTSNLDPAIQVGLVGPPNIIAIAGQGFLPGFLDRIILFNSDTRQLAGIWEGTGFGTAAIDLLEFIPIRNELWAFRAGGQITINPWSASPITFHATGGTPTLATAHPQRVFVTSTKVVILYSGQNYAVVLNLVDHSLAGYVAIPNIAGVLGDAAYNHIAGRIAIIAGAGGYLFNLTILDIAAITTSVQVIDATPTGGTTFTPSYSVAAIQYWNKKYFIGANGGGTPPLGTTLYVVDAVTYALDSTFTYEAFVSQKLIQPLLVPKGAKPYLLSFDNNNVKRLYFAGAMTGQLLSEIVTDLSIRAGLSAPQFNVTPLTDMVDGYSVARQTSVRTAIDALRPAYFFDAVESQGVIKYVKRGGATVAVIPDTDLAAFNGSGSSPDPLSTRRQMEVELPKNLSVTYLLKASLYSPATKSAARLVGSSGTESAMDFPLTLTDTKAQEVADVNLHVAWVQRLTYTLSVPRKYSHLEPTDAIVVKNYTMRISKITAQPGGQLLIEAARDDANTYTPVVVVTETPPVDQTPLEIPVTYLMMM